jgi:hypothetical protein
VAPNPGPLNQNGPTRMLLDPADNHPAPGAGRRNGRHVFTRPAAPKPLPPRLHGADIAGQLRARRQASYRLAPLDCGCRDPWPCRHTEPPPSERQADAYRDAVLHLTGLGLTPAPRLPEMRDLWRRGPAERRLIGELATRWELAG